jgi:hypothetical protein
MVAMKRRKEDTYTLNGIKTDIFESLKIHRGQCLHHAVRIVDRSSIFVLKNDGHPNKNIIGYRPN